MEDQEDEVGMQRQGTEKEDIYNQVLKDENIDIRQMSHHDLVTTGT